MFVRVLVVRMSKTSYTQCVSCYRVGNDVKIVLEVTGRQLCFICEDVPESEWDTYALGS